MCLFLEDLFRTNYFISYLCYKVLFQKLIGPFGHRYGNQDTRFSLCQAEQRTLISLYISGPITLGQENLLQHSKQKNS